MSINCMWLQFKMILIEFQSNKENIVRIVFDDDINATVIMLETNLN